MSLDSLHDELKSAERRLARMVNERADAEEARSRASAAERMMAERERAREDAERRREYQARYADSFAAFGSLPPAPIEDERPGVYRARLFELLRRKLPSGHELAAVRADDLSSASDRVRANFERMLLEAATAEGEKPSPENLPRDGSMVSRVRVDPDTGEKRTEWFGRRSFIADMGRESRRVLRIVGKDNTVLWGAPFSKAG